MNESLEARLLKLQIDLPRGLSERALARGRMASKTQGRQLQRRSLRVALALVAVSLIAAANLPAAYFFPRYANALANAPLVGAVSAPVLRAAGLTNAELTPADSSSVSNGHTLHLTAAYADSFRTVLVVEIDGQPLQLDRKQPPPQGLTVAAFQLTDQFGHRYRDQRTSPFSPIEVDPLVGLAASAGARLTLHVTALDYYDLGTYTTTHGDWTLRATVFQVPGRVLPLPASGSIGNTHYTVTYLSVSASLLYVHVAVTGDAPRLLQELPNLDPRTADATTLRIRGEQQANLIRAYYRTVLMAPDGTEAPERSGNFGGDAIDETFVLTGPGTYHLTIGSLATGIYDAAITV
jgi:hypothetical protein